MKKLSNLRLHLGAHKTATTHIQNILELHQVYLSKMDIDYIPRTKLRSQKFSRYVNRVSRVCRNYPDIAFYMLVAKINNMRSGLSTLVLSEENLIAEPSVYFNNKIFISQIENRIGALSSLVPWTNLQILLAIRSPDTFLRSAFAQTLRTKRIPGGFESIKENVLQDPLCWTELISHIKNILPNVKLTVWRYEDYVSNIESILTLICGVKICLIRDMPIPLSTKTPSDNAIHEIEKLNPNLNIKKYKAEVRKIIDIDSGTLRFSPFSENESQYLMDVYKKDVENLDRYFPGVLVKFESNSS